MKLKTAEATLALAQDRRETYAREIFAYETVNEQILEAAKLGESYVRIQQKMPVSLKSMKATRQLAAELLKAQFIVEWVVAIQPEKSSGRETGGFINYEEMRISWDTVHIISGPQVTND